MEETRKEETDTMVIAFPFPAISFDPAVALNSAFSLHPAFVWTVTFGPTVTIDPTVCRRALVTVHQCTESVVFIKYLHAYKYRGRGTICNIESSVIDIKSPLSVVYRALHRYE
jgi:hypothetical protein